MILTFPDGFDPRGLPDEFVAVATRHAWLEHVNALLDQERQELLAHAGPEDYATPTAEDLEDTQELTEADLALFLDAAPPPGRSAPAELLEVPPLDEPLDAGARAAVEKYLNDYGRDVPL